MKLVKFLVGTLASLIFFAAQAETITTVTTSGMLGSFKDKFGIFNSAGSAQGGAFTATWSFESANDVVNSFSDGQYAESSAVSIDFTMTYVGGQTSFNNITGLASRYLSNGYSTGLQNGVDNIAAVMLSGQLFIEARTYSSAGFGPAFVGTSLDVKTRLVVYDFKE